MGRGAVTVCLAGAIAVLTGCNAVDNLLSNTGTCVRTGQYESFCTVNARPDMCAPGQTFVDKRGAEGFQWCISQGFSPQSGQFEMTDLRRSELEEQAADGEVVELVRR